MFCGKCGKENPDGTLFCAGCGEPLAQPAQPGAAKVAVGESKRNKLIGVGAVGVVVVLAAVLLIVLLSGRSADSAAEKFITAVFKGDGEAIVDLVPSDLIEEYADDAEMSRREVKKELEEEFERQFGDYSDFMDEMKVTARAVGSDGYGRRERADIIDRYDELDVDVKDLKTVSVELTLKLGGDKRELDDPIEVPVIKVGGSWYIDFLNLDDMGYSLMSALMGISLD